jgi:hypothetical protein
MTQQSPHSGLRQRAQGPAAVAPQLAQCSKPPPSPLEMSCPLIALSGAAFQTSRPEDCA